MRFVRQTCSLVALLLLSATSAWAQQRRVTGRVTVEGSGEPLNAATVNVVGTTIGTFTDEDGRFTLLAPEGTFTLRVRRIGYAQRSLPVPAGQAEVNVALTRDVLQLETQVITGTATSVSSRNAANSVAQVSGEQLNRAPTPTIENALQGKVPGAIITTNSGAPGGGAQIQLRGVTSILATSSPLYVVDGVIVNNAEISNGLNALTQAASATPNVASTQDQAVNRIADLNPANIETIEVLKGAAAASIYGSKGSNGVIIITTKRGTSGRPRVNVTQRFGTFDLSNKLGVRCFETVGEYLDYAGAETAEDTTNITAEFGSGGCNDYEEQLYGRHALSYETDLSVAGGNGGTTYFVSGLAKRDAGIQEGTGYRKQALRVNLGQQIGSKLNLRANTELIHSLTERGLSGNDNAGVSPYTIFSSTPSFYNLEPREGTYPRNPYLPFEANPFQIANQLKTPENVYRFIGSATANISAYASERQTVDFTLTGGVDSYSQESKLYAPPTLYFEPLDDGLPGTVVNNQGNVINANLNASATHRYTTAPFTATTSAGVRQERRQQQVVLATGRGLPPGQANVSDALQIINDEERRLIKDQSFFVQEEFLTLGERLLLTGAVNFERSSLNGDDEKFFTFPKASASYRLPWLPRFTDELKVRVAYGEAGNLPRYGDKYTSLITSPNDGVIGGRPSAILGLADVKPEVSKELEGGFDLQGFGGRVATDVTLFRKQVDDLLLQPTLSPTTGFTSRVVNGGQLVNRGLEIGLNLTPVQTERFTWVSRTTYSEVRGQVTRLDVPSFDAGSYFSTRYGNIRIEEGKSPTQVFSQAGCRVPFNAAGRCPTASIIFAAVGDATPDYQMGFSNDFTFGPVRFASLFDWRKGGKVVNLTNNYFDGSGLNANPEEGAARLAAYRRGETVYTEDATFVKLRELTLSYSLPASLTGTVFNGRAQDVRLELSGRNLYTWTPYTGLDPEVSNFGSQNIGRFQDVTPFPPSRSFFFSIAADF